MGAHEARASGQRGPGFFGSEVLKGERKNMKIYLAGRISKEDWRMALVPELAHGINNSDDWHIVEAMPVADSEHEYVGPFFFSCDHGCGHMERGHGAISGCSSVSRQDVIAKSQRGIRAA